jgi:hypothetical protein
MSEVLTEVLNERAKHLAVETGFIQRVRTFDGADFAQGLIFGWLQEPDCPWRDAARSWGIGKSI